MAARRGSLGFILAQSQQRDHGGGVAEANKMSQSLLGLLTMNTLGINTGEVGLQSAFI